MNPNQGDPTTPFVPSFGALPIQKRSPTSIAVATTIEVAILTLAVFLGLTARKTIVLRSYQVTDLTAPALLPPPKYKLPPPPKVQPLKITTAAITPPRISPPPAPKIKPIELTAPKPDFQATALRHVVLAPQVKRVQFALTAAPARAMRPRTVASVNFNNAPAARFEKARRAVVSAAFGATSGGPRAQRGVVSSAGFGDSSHAARGRRVGRVAAADFGGNSRTGDIGARGEVASTGFGVMREAASVHRAQAPPPTTSLIILSKPPVAYTEAARAKHIQGDVVLNVTFTASGRVIVHDVVRGLGYGLDQEARRVAQGIRFRPALRNGHPVSVTTEITITFQLA